jgi:catechol 2,3-dioxygenase-like lactoylglutathione lyase family enzyme
MLTTDAKAKSPTSAPNHDLTAGDPSLQGLLHIGLKTADLQKTVEFYCNLLGMTEVWRPPFDYPGAWLASQAPDSILIHLYAGKAAVDSQGLVATGTGAIDHVAIGATGFQAMRERLRASGHAWRQHVPPNTHIWQLFIYDPNGVMIEMNFDGTKEQGPPPSRDDGPWYVAGENFSGPRV